MNFRKWLENEIVKEMATGTNCVAGFARISLPLVRRQYPEDPFFKKRKKKRVDK